MSDANARDPFSATHERNREQRIGGIKRWVEYLKSEPPEKGGHDRTRSSTINSKRPSVRTSASLSSA